MNRMWSIAAMIVLSVAISDDLASQQTNFAIQVVTFGVARTPQTLVSALTLPPPSDRLISSTSSSRTPQQTLASIPAKITFSTKVSGTAGSHRKDSSNSGNSGYSADSYAASTLGNEGRNQTDLKTFLLKNKLLAVSSSSLILTITD